jgi:RES domain-containing protein
MAVQRPVTYCSTVPSLTALEKRVHVVDRSLLPPQAMVEYAVPDDARVHSISFDSLPSDWASRGTHTQALGNALLDECTALILVVPSVITHIAGAPDRNVLINHRHSRSDQITITSITPFTFDPRLFQT